MRTMMSPLSRKVCPASRPNGPPLKSVVMAAVVPSVMPISAKKIPYHRAAGQRTALP